MLVSMQLVLWFVLAGLFIRWRRQYRRDLTRALKVVKAYKWRRDAWIDAFAAMQGEAEEANEQAFELTLELESYRETDGAVQKERGRAWLN